MSKKLIWVIVLVLVALGIFLLLRKEEVLAPNEELPAALPQEETTNTEVVNENLITYSDTGFAPSTLTVKVGDTVTWKNEGEKSMWPASATTTKKKKRETKKQKKKRKKKTPRPPPRPPPPPPGFPRRREDAWVV